MGDGVVVANGDEVKPPSGCSFNGQEEWARDGLSRLTGAVSIAVRSVCVQITAIPSGCVAQRLFREGRVIDSAIEPDLRSPTRNYTRTYIRDREEKLPAARRNGSGKIGRRSIGLADGEMVFVTATRSAKTDRVGNAEINYGALIVTEVVEGNCNAMRSLWNNKWSFDVGLVLTRLYLAMQNQVWRRRRLRQSEKTSLHQNEEQQSRKYASHDEADWD